MPRVECGPLMACTLLQVLFRPREPFSHESERNRGAPACEASIMPQHRTARRDARHKAPHPSRSPASHDEQCMPRVAVLLASISSN
jgi:hypothetical protein